MGSTSTIGRAAAAELGRSGAEVVTAGRRHADVPLDIADDVPGVLRTRDQQRLRCDVVVHAAGTVGGHDAASEASAWAVNARGAGAVGRLAAASGARRVVQLSTVYAACPECYPGPQAYPRSKAAGEDAMADAVGGHGLELIVLRLTHVYDAAGGCRANQPLPYLFADRAEADEPLEVHGDGTARRDYLHLADAAEAVRLASTTAVLGTWTIGSPAMHSIAEVADAARQAFGATAPVRLRHDLPGPAGMVPWEPGGWDALGGAPSVDVHEGFRRMRVARAEQSR